MAIEKSKYLRVRIMGESVATPYDSKIALMQTHSTIKTTDSVKTIYDPFPFFALDSIDTAVLFKVNLEQFFDNSAVGEYLDYKIRMYPNLNTGFNLRFTHVLVGTTNYLSMTFKAVQNGGVWENSLTTPGVYYTNDEQQKNQYCIPDKHGQFRFIPILVNVGEEGYMWGYTARWYGNTLSEHEAGIVVSHYYGMPPYISPEAVAGEVDNYPYESDDTESGGNGTLDDSSDDVVEPDDALTEEINTIVGSGGFLSMYKMSLSQLQMFASELWDYNLITQIKHYFDNPMDAVVSLQMLPFSVPSTSNRPLKLAGVTMGNATGGVITNSQVTIDCGAIDLSPYWDNFLDLACTTIKIFLPFVGIHEINPQYIQGGTLSVKYKVDVMTGAFVCWLKYTKDGHTNILNRFSGTMAMQLPVTSGGHGNIVGALASTVASSVALGGALMAATGTAGAATAATAAAVKGGLISAGSSAASALNQAMMKNFQESGSYNMNIGFMDNRTPYLIIERPKSVMPTGYNKTFGTPSFASATLNQCHGYTRIASWQPTFSNISEEEVQEMTSQLVNGVILP